MSWRPGEIQLPSFHRGWYLIRRILEALPELAEVRIGLLHVFLQHTSASLSIDENADRDVPVHLDWVFASLARGGKVSPGEPGVCAPLIVKLSRPRACRCGDRRPDGRYGLAAHLRPTGRGMFPPVKGG